MAGHWGTTQQCHRESAKAEGSLCELEFEGQKAMLREQGKCKEQLAWPDMGRQKERAEGSLCGQTCEGRRRRAEGSLRGQIYGGKRKMQRQRAG